MLNIKSGLAALGVNALRPPDTTIADRAPTINDYNGYEEMHLWFYKTTTTPPFYYLYFLASKSPVTGSVQEATWLRIYPNTIVDNGGNLLTDDGIVAYPDTNGNIGVISGESYGGNPVYINTYTKNYNATTMTVALKRSINQPLTNATASEGMYALGEHNFLYSYGPRNTMVGLDSANLSIDIVTCTDTTAIGNNVLASIYNGSSNTGLGSNVLPDLISGSKNLSLGFNSGDNYKSNESNNILVGSEGVVHDQGMIRIGDQALQSKCFVAGIWNGTYAGALDTGMVIVNEDGQLYVDNIADNSVVFTDTTGNFVGVNAAEGYILTGQGIGVGPEFQPLTSSGGSVAISFNAVTKSVNLEATGVAALTQLPTDAGTAAPLAGEITIAGGELIETDAAVPNTVTINLTRGADLEVIAGNTGAAPTYKGLQSNDGSIIFDIATYPGMIDMVAPGGGGGTITYLSADSGAPATPVLGTVKIASGTNIVTASIAGQVTVSVTDDVNLAGYLYSVTDIKTSTGNLVATAGMLKLTNSDAAGTMGQVQLNSIRFLSNFGTDNTFLGSASGNTTLTAISAISNTFLGSNSGTSVVTGAHNLAAGYNSMRDNDSGSFCVALGDGSLLQATGSSYNIAVGYHSGINYTGATNNSNICIGNTGTAGQSNAIIIGTDGVGSGQQDKCYLAGVYSGTVGTTPRYVLVGSEGKLSSTAGGGAGGVTIFIGSSGTATCDTATLYVTGGTNINTVGSTGAQDRITINLNHSIQLPDTSSDASDGVISIGTGTIINTRFAHARNGNTYCGTLSGNLASVGATYNSGFGASSLENISSGDNNVAVGDHAMWSALTSSNSTCLGYSAGAGLTSGSNCILIGRSAGTAYSTQSNNIIIGDSTTGVAGETGVMKLGYPVNTTSTTMYGVYGKSVDAATSETVLMDSTGKMGTVSTAKIAFHAIQSGTTVGVTGDGTVYDLGTKAIFVEEYDYSNNFYPGDGLTLRAYFAAPKDGLYMFIVTVLAGGLPLGATTRVDPINITITNAGGIGFHHRYSLINPVVNYNTASGTQTIQFCQIADMVATAQAYFSFALTTSVGTKTVTVNTSYTTLSGFYI